MDLPEAKRLLASSHGELVSVRSWDEFIGRVIGIRVVVELADDDRRARWELVWLPRCLGIGVPPSGPAVGVALFGVAREGLHALQVPAEDIDYYLGTLAERIDSGRTGARWLLAQCQSTTRRKTS